MKIDFMDSSLTSLNIVKDNSVRDNTVKVSTPVESNNRTVKETGKDSLIENSNKVVDYNAHITDFQKKELNVPDKVVIDAIEKANKAISISNHKFEYAIHQKTKQIMIKVIDADTNEVVREIPPEKVLDMVAKMWEMAGLIVDERR